MAYVQIPTRTSASPNSESDINQLQDNIDAILGSEAATGPADALEDKFNIADIDDTPADDADTAVSSKWIYDNVSSIYTLSKAGTIIAYGNDSVPNGYLACDGSAVSRTTYATLFTAISTTWGVGDGSTTFNLPDLRGMFIRGTGTHGSLTMADTNAFAGPSVGSSENDQLQGHWHRMLTTALTYAAGAAATYPGGVGTIDTWVTAAVTDGTNGTPRAGDETRPVAYGVKYCIKY